MRRCGGARWLVGLGALSCGGGDDLPGDGSLVGTWTLPESAWVRSADRGDYDDFDFLDDRQTRGSTLCNLKMTGSKGEVECEVTVAGALREDGTARFSYALSASVEVSEKAVMAEGRWASESEYSYRYGERRHTGSEDCELTFQGEAERAEGRSSEGRFDALAGLWHGAVTSSGRCLTQQDDESDEDTLGGSWRFEADLYGEQGTLRVVETGEADEATWVVQNSPLGVLVREFGHDSDVLADEVD